MDVISGWTTQQGQTVLHQSVCSLWEPLDFYINVKVSISIYYDLAVKVELNWIPFIFIHSCFATYFVKHFVKGFR